MLVQLGLVMDCTAHCSCPLFSGWQQLQQHVFGWLHALSAVWYCKGNHNGSRDDLRKFPCEFVHTLSATLEPLWTMCMLKWQKNVWGNVNTVLKDALYIRTTSIKKKATIIGTKASNSLVCASLSRFSFPEWVLKTKNKWLFGFWFKIQKITVDFVFVSLWLVNWMSRNFKIFWFRFAVCENSDFYKIK